jgi:glutamate racemase
VRRVEQLFGLGCRLVILACNTASAVALRRLQQTWLPHHYPDRRVLGVLVPMVEAITGVPWMADVPAGGPPGTPRTVAVFATQRTVSSEAYPREIGKRSPEVHVVQQACPNLARLIEEGAAAPELEHWVRRYVAALLDGMGERAPDVAVLGCTHYPLIEEMFRAALPAGVDLLSQPDLVARSLAAYLERHPEFATTGEAGAVRFLTTGDPARVEPLARRFFGAPVSFGQLADDAEPALAL